MKVFLAIIIVFLLSTLNLLLMDFLLGFSLLDSFMHLLNPFWVMSKAEYIMLAGLFLIVIGQQIFMIIKRKKEKRYHPN
ncbi:UNVERIFIED_ORG: flagellar biosynthesis component FlhA [Bacillus sp. 1751]|nr:flagellar biosynthesis component FlhA [Bacillus sp. 1751]